MEPIKLPIILSASDQEFERRLMVSPKAGLAWADQVIGTGTLSDQAIACRVALSSNPAWAESERLAAKNVRLKAWAKSPWPDEVEARLPLMWEFEALQGPPAINWGADAWRASMSQAHSFGVSLERVETLGLLADKSAMMKAWGTGLTPNQALRHFDEAAGGISNCQAPRSWQLQLAGCLTPKDAAQKVIGCWSSKNENRRLNHLDPAAAQQLAAVAFSDPHTSFKAMRGILMRQYDPNQFFMLPNPIEGVLRYLTSNPAPRLAQEWERSSVPVPKLYGSSKAALSVAFELMCKLNISAGLEAVRWACALGAAPGKQPSNERTDGVDLNRFPNEVKLFVFDNNSRFKSLDMRILGLAEPALLMGDREACLALREMGWSWPRKERVKQMHDELKTFLKLATGYPPIELVSGKPIDDDYPAAFMAFWEELCLSNELPIVQRESGPARRPRI